MSADFPYQVGDKVRLPRWSDGLYVTVTHVGVDMLLAMTRIGTEAAFQKSLNWLPYVEPPQPPDWLSEMWTNVHQGLIVGAWPSAQEADRRALGGRIGRVKLDLSTWVPCNGKEVLG